MTIRALQIEDMEPIRQWRNQCLATLRTPFPLTKEQQEDWYRSEVCNRASRTRFWAIEDEEGLIGYGGIEGIQWENSIGEISLLINPELHGKGYGMQAVKLILGEAFGNLGLKTVYGECYMNNPAVKFWQKITETVGGEVTHLPRRKLWAGEYHGSMVFTIY